MGSLRCLGALTAGFFIVASAGNDVVAQTARSGGGAANAQLVLQLQQLASERTALQAENTRIQGELADARKERDALKKTQQTVDARVKAGEAALARNAAERETSERDLKQTKDKLQELIAKFRETVQALREVETQNAATKQGLAARERDLKACVEHNDALFRIDEEVLTRLEHQSVWSRVASAEPFTRLKRVELENLADDYRSRAEDQRLKSAVPGQPPAPQAGQAAGQAGQAGQPAAVPPAHAAPAANEAAPRH